MVLEQKTSSQHNRLRCNNNVGMKSVSKKIPHPASTRYDENVLEDFVTPSPKRRKLVNESEPEDSPLNRSPSSVGNKESPRRKNKHPQEGEGLKDTSRQLPHGNVLATQLDAALLPALSDEEAIEAYEAYKAGEAQIGAAGEDSVKSRFENRAWTRGKNSLYVDAFNLALDTVLEEETHLFNAAERAVFEAWRGLSYEAQYLYVRLFLRKIDQWFRVGKLGYHGDISDIEKAVEELEQNRAVPEVEEDDVINPGETRLPEDAQPLGKNFRFAEFSDDHISSLDEAGSLLLLDELKAIAKEAKVKGATKKELLQNLQKTSGKQSGLGFLRRSETEDSSASTNIEDVSDPDDGDEKQDISSNGRHTPLPRTNRDEHYRRKILAQTGKCVRLSLLPHKLFERLHLVFYRSTEWTDKSLTTLILAKISRRNFAEYIVSRSANIFESRAFLLEFEASLRTQFRVDSLLEFNGTPGPKQFDVVLEIFEAVYPRWKVLVRKEQQKEDSIYETGEGAYLRRFSPAWVYTRIVHKGLQPLARFKEHMREHSLLCELLDQRLFHAARRGAWYQRKALLEEHYMYALADAQGRSEEVNKKHWKRVSLKTCEQGLQDKECHLIYHYDLQKRIVKLERQLKIPKREQHEFAHVSLSKAHERTIHGVQLIRDRDETPSRSNSRRRSTGAAPNLKREASSIQSKPVKNEESGLQPSEEDKRFAKEVDRLASLASVEIEADSDHQSAIPRAAILAERSATTNNIDRGRPALIRRSSVSTKTWWLDSHDTGEAVSVESLALSHYRKYHHYKGYHSEGGILRTLFGLLFYDILFETYVPNVFQTAYQTCPLDLHTDAFYTARLSEINQRINEIGAGQAEYILRATWSAHRERKTCIVGVRWEEYEIEDLAEICRCFEGEGLGVCMRVLAQDYGGRGGGVPDLFLWKPGGYRHLKPAAVEAQAGEQIEREDSPSWDLTTGTNIEVDIGPTKGDIERGKRYKSGIGGRVMFVEVKSENDRLSDTQRLWISVMLNAGIEVELCHVSASDMRSM